MTDDHHKDVYDEERFDHDEDEEETEYYDMSAFERRLMRRVNFMDNKLDRILDMAGDHNTRIRSIQFQYTRQTLFWLIKWGLIIGFLAYFYFNFIQPITNPDKAAESDGESMMIDASQIRDYISSFLEQTEAGSGE